MVYQLSIEEGTFLVSLARQSVIDYLQNGEASHLPKTVSPKLMERCGVFVTLKLIRNGVKMLRGCIGFPYPTTPLARAVMKAAVSASTQDPRFPTVTLQELSHIAFEVSVLTPPELITAEEPTDLPSKIKVGRDGLIIEKGYHKGLLLPQVPVEQNWNSKEFLSQTAVKAGLQSDAWLLKNTKIYIFQAIIFEEEKPKGEIQLKKI